MLKVSVIKSSNSAKSSKISDYYKNEEKHLAIKQHALMSKAEAKAQGIGEKHIIKDYGEYVLAENPKARTYSEWGGALAEKAGLAGQVVTTEKLTEILEGNLLGQSIQRGSHQNKRCGHDLTFSAPKSISIMGLLYGDTRLLEAHQHAVKEAMAEFARLVPVMRIQDPSTKKIMRIKTDQIIYAMEMHRVSRNLDPQLHTHCLTMNMAIDDKGKLRAINIDDLYDQKLNLYLGKLYQASLNKRTRALGYDTYAVGHGQFEIKGMPKAFLESFSTRRLEIQNKIFALNASKAHTIDEIAKFTRQPKQYVEQKYLHALWEDRKQDFDGAGFYHASHQKAEQIKTQAAEKSQQTTMATDAIKLNAEKPKTQTKADYVHMLTKGDAASAMVELTLSHIGRFQTRMSYHDILSKALDEFAIDGGVSVGDLKHALETKIKSGEITALDKPGSILTTAKQRQDELYLQSLLSKQVKNMKTLITSDDLKSVHLTPENQRSVIKLFASTKQANMLNIKGASKSAITALIHGAVALDKNIKILTPNHYHVADIKAHTNQPVRESNSLFSWLKNAFLFQADADYVETLGGFTFKQAKENTLSNRDIIVVDQAEKLSVKDAQTLLEITQAGKAKLIYLNRDGAKDNKKTSGNIIETLKLGGIASMDFHYQKTAQASLNIQAHKDDDDRTQALVSAYQGLSKDAQDNTLVVTYSKKEVDTLNTALREAIQRDHPNTPRLTLKMEKRVFMTPEQACVAKSYLQGERVEFFTNSGVLAYKITGIDRKNNLVKTEALKSSVIEHLLGSSPKATAFNPLENKNPVALIRTEAFEVMKGEKLMVLNTKIPDLTKGTSYQVYDFDAKNLQLLDQHGEIITVSHKDFQRSNVQYDYVRTLDYVSENEAKNFMATFKQYRLDKELTTELVTKAKDRIELFTDDLKKAEMRMGESGVQPSTITTIIKAHFSETEALTKYVTDETKEKLTRDLQQALGALHIEANRSAIDKSVEHAINVLSDQQAAFAHTKLVDIAAKHCLNEYHEAIDYASAKQALDALFAEGKVIASKDNLFWTTQAAIELERGIVELSLSGKKTVVPLASMKNTEDYLKNHQANNPEHRQLRTGQRDAIKLITNTQDRFIAIQGYAGTGKSTMLQQAQHIALHVKHIQPEANIAFIGFAPTHTAVKALSQKNIKSQTLQSLLFDYAKDNPEKQGTGDLTNKVFVLDEASMVSNQDCHQFMQLVKDAGARAVFVGDIKQEESLSAGAPLKMLVMGDKIDVALMRDIKRQKDANYLSAVKAVTRNQPDLAYDLLNEQASYQAIQYRPGQQPATLEISVVESKVKKLKPEKWAKSDQLAFIKTFNALVDGKQPDENDPNRDKVIGLFRKLKIEAIKDNMAIELGARTEASRNKTITVLDAHDDREALTQQVRHKDKVNQLISGHEAHNIRIGRLKNKNLTPHQMHDITQYKANMVLQKGLKNYYEILAVDQENSVLKIKDIATDKISYFAPLRANHHFNGLFEVKHDEVALREQLIMTKTDKSKGIFAKDKMRVTAIDQIKGLVTLTNQEKQNQVTLNQHDLATLHWDYALTTTTFSSQGTDKPFAVVAHKSTSPLASIRSLYVGLTRGSRHIKVFTDDKAAFLKRIKTEFKDNTIAINKVTGEITLSEYFDRYRQEKKAAKVATASKVNNTNEKSQYPPSSKPIVVAEKSQGVADSEKAAKAKTVDTSAKVPDSVNQTTQPEKTPLKADIANKYANTVLQQKVYDPKYLDSNGRFDIRKYGAEVAEELKKYTESIAQQLLGQPNQSRSDNKVMAYGKNNGSLKITLTGKWRGYFKDWSTGDRGDMLTLLMRETGMSYADAVAEGAKMVSMPEAFRIKETKGHDKLTQEATDKQKKSYEKALKTWENAHPVKGTLAEKYLTKHRQITDYQGADIRFHPSIYSKEVKGLYQPALVVQFKDKDGKLTGVESIYLERNTAKKMSKLKVPKRGYGTKKGSCVLINSGNNQRNITLIAEGVVTALSVKQAFKDDHILAVGGKENFANIDPKMLKKHVLLCADNDGINLKEDRVFNKTISILEKAGKKVSIVIPDSIKGLAKSDYNDTLKQGGIKAVFDNINPVYQRALREENAINNAINQSTIQENNAINVSQYHGNSPSIDAKSIDQYLDKMNKKQDEITKNNLDYAKKLETEKQTIVPDKSMNHQKIKPQLTK